MERCHKTMEKVPIRRTMVKTKNSKDEAVRSPSPTSGESPAGDLSLAQAVVDRMSLSG